MTKVVFTKKVGRFHKGQTVDFPPALADFFVSKVKCAEMEKKVEDFSDVLGAQTPAPKAKAEQTRPSYVAKKKNKNHSNRDAGRYGTKDMRASE